jgi:hypothetical protein
VGDDAGEAAKQLELLFGGELTPEKSLFSENCRWQISVLKSAGKSWKEMQTDHQ